MRITYTTSARRGTREGATRLLSGQRQESRAPMRSASTPRLCRTQARRRLWLQGDLYPSRCPQPALSAAASPGPARPARALPAVALPMVAPSMVARTAAQWPAASTQPVLRSDIQAQYAAAPPRPAYSSGASATAATTGHGGARSSGPRIECPVCYTTVPAISLSDEFEQWRDDQDKIDELREQGMWDDEYDGGYGYTPGSTAFHGRSNTRYQPQKSVAQSFKAHMKTHVYHHFGTNTWGNGGKTYYADSTDDDCDVDEVQNKLDVSSIRVGNTMAFVAGVMMERGETPVGGWPLRWSKSLMDRTAAIVQEWKGMSMEARAAKDGFWALYDDIEYDPYATKRERAPDDWRSDRYSDCLSEEEEEEEDDEDDDDEDEEDDDDDDGYDPPPRKKRKTVPVDHPMDEFLAEFSCGVWTKELSGPDAKPGGGATAAGAAGAEVGSSSGAAASSSHGAADEEDEHDEDEEDAEDEEEDDAAREARWAAEEIGRSKANPDHWWKWHRPAEPEQQDAPTGPAAGPDSNKRREDGHSNVAGAAAPAYQSQLQCIVDGVPFRPPDFGPLAASLREFLASQVGMAKAGVKRPRDEDTHGGEA